MDELVIVTRDVNGYTFKHYLLWDRVCHYIATHEEVRDTEILLVLFEGMCIYSALGSDRQLSWDEVVGFFS